MLSIRANTRRWNNMLLELSDLHIQFETEDQVIRAVDGVSFTLDRGQVLGLVGESGCSKSATAMIIPRLLPMPPARITSGQHSLRRPRIGHLAVAPELRQLRSARIGVIFQDALSALSPLHRIGRQLAEVLKLHRDISTAAARDIARDWLGRVGIPDPDACLTAYPHELSGGMQQRVMIAMGLILEPDLVIADEPTTALDVTIQAQVLNLMRRLYRQNSGAAFDHAKTWVWFHRWPRILRSCMPANLWNRPTPQAFSPSRVTPTRSRCWSHALRRHTRPSAQSHPRTGSVGRAIPAGLPLHDRCPVASSHRTHTRPRQALRRPPRALPPRTWGQRTKGI